MNKIGKNYLRNFMKDFWITALITIYLIIMFMTVFIVSNTSLQLYFQYRQISEKSKPWSSNYNDNLNLEWYIDYLGKKDKGSKNDFFNILDNLSFKNSNNDDNMYIFKHDKDNPWYKNIYEDQMSLKWPTQNNKVSNDYVNLAKKMQKFDKCLDNDINELSYINYYVHSDANEIKKLYFNISSKENNNTQIGDIFNINVDNIKYWKQNSFSVWKILLEKIITLKNENDKTCDLSYNKILTVKNYVGSATLSNKITNKVTRNDNYDVWKQELAITFCDNSYRNGMSQVFLQNKEGRMPKNDNEILINKEFAINNGWKIGDKINLFGNISLFPDNMGSLAKNLINKEFLIVGYGMSLATANDINSYNNGDLGFNNNNNLNYGNVYTTYNEFNLINSSIYNQIEEVQKSEWNSQQIEWTNNNLKSDNKLLNFGSCAYDLISKNSKELDNLITNLLYNKYSKNFSTSSITDNFYNYTNTNIYKKISTNKTNIIINFIILLMLSLFSFIFLNITIKRDINLSKRQLGIFKSMGYKTKELAFIYSYKTFIIFLVSSVLGYLLSIPFQIYTSSDFFDHKIVLLTLYRYNHMFLLLIFTFVIITCAFGFFSFLLNLIYLNLDPLELMQGNDKTKNIFILNISRHLIIRKNNNTVKLKHAFTIKSIWKWISMYGLFLISLTLLMLNGGILNYWNNYIQNIETITYGKDTNNFYSIKNFGSNDISLSSDRYHFITKEFSVDNNPFYIKNSNDKNVEDKINESVYFWHNNLDWRENIAEHPYIYVSDLMKLESKSPEMNDKNITNTNIENAILNLKYINHNDNYKKYDDPRAPIVCLNNLTMPENNNLYCLMNHISSNDILEKNNKSLNIVGWDDRWKYNDFKKYCNIKGMSISTYKNMLNYNDEDNTIPVVISKKSSFMFNWKINDTISGNNLSSYGNNLNSYNVKINNIKLKIVGILNNLYSCTIYTGYSNLAKFYNDNKNQNYATSTEEGKYGLFNSWYGSQNLYPNFKTQKSVNNDWLNFYKLNKIKSDDPYNMTPKNNLPLKYFYIATYHNTNNVTSKETLFKYIEDWNNTSSKKDGIYNDFFNLTKVMNISQIKNSINDKEKKLKHINSLENIFLLILVSILIIILLLIIIDENKKIIMMLKVLGYENKTINLVTMGNLIGVIFYSLVFSMISAYIILKELERCVRIKLLLFIDLHLSFYNILEIIGIVLFISLGMFKISMNAIKKDKLEELTKMN